MARAEIQSTGDAAFGERGEERRHGTVQNQHGLVETGRIEAGGDAGNARQRLNQALGAFGACRRHALQALGPEQRKINRGGRHQQSLVGADVGGGLAAPDVLFARLQCQREAGPALRVDGAPTMRPGICRTCDRRVAMKPK